MKNVVMPLSAVLFSLLLFFIYISKKRVNLKENKVYLVMIIAILIDSILSSSIQFLTLFKVDDTIFLIADVLNRIDFFTLLVFASSLFLYTHSITVDDGIEKIDRVGITLLIINIFIFIAYSFCGITFISNGVDYSIKGDAVNIVYVSVGVYLLLALLVVIFNIKKLDKRHIPLGATIILASLDLLAFSVNPYLVIIPTTLTFINYIMYFTIENPDMKMLEQVSFAKEQAELSSQIKTSFLSSMSCEIRTPLNAIMCLSEDNLRYREELPKEVIENCEDINHAGDTLNEIVTNILEMNRIESNQMEIVEVDYNFAREIRLLCEKLKKRIGEKNVFFKFHVADDVPYNLHGDRDKVISIVSNVVSNAIKYTDEGEITLEIKCINDNNKKISNLYISCQDTGRGIRQDEFSKIFNKFERLGVEKDTSIQGTGLGLSITKSLVEMLGGNITVSSQYGKGSIFIINLPQKISDAPIEKKEVVYNNDTKVSYGNKKVLLVDEDKVNIKIYRKELEDFNLTIEECNSSSECFEKIITGREYSLILMSLSLEELNGYKTLERLKENPTFEIPVIALTNDPDADIEKIKSSGFYDCVIKSFTKEEMREKLDKLFRKTNFGDNFVMEAFSDMSKPVKDIVIPNSVDASDSK